MCPNVYNLRFAEALLRTGNFERKFRLQAEKSR